MFNFFLPKDPTPDPLPETLDDNVSIAKEAITFKLGEEMVSLIDEAEVSRGMYCILKHHHAMVCSSFVSALQDELYEAMVEGKTVLKLGAELQRTIYNLRCAGEDLNDASARRHLIRAVS